MFSYQFCSSKKIIYYVVISYILQAGKQFNIWSTDRIIYNSLIIADQCFYMFKMNSISNNISVVFFRLRFKGTCDGVNFAPLFEIVIINFYLGCIKFSNQVMNFLRYLFCSKFRTMWWKILKFVSIIRTLGISIKLEVVKT